MSSRYVRMQQSVAARYTT